MNGFRERAGYQWALLSSVACLIAGWISYLLQPHADPIFSWRPTAGVLLALLLLHPPSRWLVMVSAAWPIEVFFHHVHEPALGWVACGLVAAVQVSGTALASHLMLRVAPGPITFDRMRQMSCLILFACVLVSLPCAALEVAISQKLPGHRDFANDWFRWWARDWLGYFLVTPAIITGVRVMGQRKSWTARQIVRSVFLIVLTVGSAAVAFRQYPGGMVGPFAMVYLPFPALVWAALRFGPAGAASTSLLFAAVAILETSMNADHLLGPITMPSAQLRWLQLYLLVSSGMTLLLAAVIREQQATGVALEESEKRYRQMAENFRLAEQEVRTTEDLYRRAIMAASAVPYLRDYGEERFLFMGEGIRELTGYTAAEMTPDLWETLAMEHVMRGPIHGLSYEDALRRTRAGEFRHWQSDALIVTQDGQERWISDASVEIHDETGKPVRSIGILMDVTDRKRAEESVRRANAGLEGRIQERTLELESAVRELESLTYSVSHDLRAPLRAIEGFARILQEDHGHDLAIEPASMLARIRSAAVRMDLLINHLLAYSRLNRQALARQKVDMNLLVRDALGELRLEQESRSVEIDHQPLPACQGDPELLRQVVLSLVSNALKYTRRREVAEIEIGWQSESEETVYFIRDNGAGFDMAYADKLFGVFHRLHRAEDFEGTGVGLAIAHRILRRHGGRIWASAVVNHGATFFFTVPSQEKEVSSVNEAQRGLIGGIASSSTRDMRPKPSSTPAV